MSFLAIAPPGGLELHHVTLLNVSEAAALIGSWILELIWLDLIDLHPPGLLYLGIAASVVASQQHHS